MQNTFEQLTEILERLELISQGNLSLPDIEKDIVLEKMRKIYAAIQSGKAPKAQPEVAATPEKYGKWRKLLLRMQTTPASVVQFFASFAIILFMTLVFVQNHQMKTADVGFETDNIYVSQFQKSAPNTTNPALKGYQEDFQCKTLDSLKGEWKKLGEIADVTWAENPILGQGASYGMVTLKAGDEMVSICDRTVSANFFRFFGIKMLEGKDFEEVCNASRNGRILNKSALKLTKQWTRIGAIQALMVLCKIFIICHSSMRLNLVSILRKSMTNSCGMIRIFTSN